MMRKIKGSPTILLVIMVLSLALFLPALQSGVGGGGQSNVGGAGVPTTLGLIASYNSVATAGIGVTPVVAFSATTPTTPVGSTTLLSAAPAGLYSLSAYYVLTTAGVGGTAITLNLSYTDAQQAQTNSSVTSSGLVLGQFAQGTAVIQQQAAGNITYTVTETGAFSTHPVLALKLVLERLQ